jgi:integrative and conjugative element protein (TIGR02256 family)
VTPWEGKTPDGEYGLRLETPVLRDLDRMCGESGWTETGGVLIGRYSADRTLAIVGEATPPPADSRRGRSWFHRGVTGLRETLARRWRSPERTHYLGEWHFHPADVVVPSADDFSQMEQIALSRRYQCREPILLIVGAGEGSAVRPLRAFVCPAAAEPKELLPTAGSNE